MKNLSVIILSIFLLATIGNAQDTVTKVKPSVLEKKAVELSFASQKVVKNKPFSAESISESIQTLPDGNRIKRSSTVKMFRDSEGRFRRENIGSEENNGSYAFDTSGFALGLWSSNTISITDPVSSVRYILNSKNKTARQFDNKLLGTVNVFGSDDKGLKEKLELFKNKEGEIKVLREKLELLKNKEGEIKKDQNIFEGNQGVTTIQGNSGVVVLKNSSPLLSYSVKPESLGTKMIEGVQAEGTRMVMTIEAGAIGNELPIETTYEKWYSKGLDMIVYSRNYDPRYGEKIYRIINIDRSEPDISLFKIPSDYKIVESGKAMFEFSTKQKK